MQQPKPERVPSEDNDEPQELARFRREWVAELQKKKTDIHSAAPTTSVTQPVAAKPRWEPWSTSAAPQNYPEPSSQTITAPSNVNASSSRIKRDAAPLPRTVGSALNVYRQAVEHEQRGELDDALLLYRQAFRTDPNVDKVYHREETLASVFAAKQAPAHNVHTDSVDPNGAVDELVIKPQHTLPLQPAGPSSAAGVVTGTLANLVANFPETLSFEPEIEQELVPLRKLPDELLIMILRKLDPTSIERFAIVNRKARIIALESTIWKDFVVATYKPPQVLDIQGMAAVVEKHLSDLRRVYIEHPRVRMDGVYIATCHYVRPGLHENAWVNISHLITYHRYLRFYSNGQVLSLLANEEHTPQQIIPLLKPTLRMKGLFIGTWHLSGSVIHLSNLIDASGRFTLPNSWNPSSIPEPPYSSPQTPSSESGVSERNRYAFLMSLNLRSRPLGRWNKLTMETYDSVNLETGDASAVALKHERPFWFSKVRSYAAY